MEVSQAIAWIVTTAKADTALMAVATGVFEGYADIGTLMPYVLIVPQVAGNDVLTMNAVRCFTRSLFQIKMIGPSSGYSSLVTGADRIDALFKLSRNVSLSPGWVLSCFREQQIAYSELINGKSHSHLGGLYHVDLQGA